jgi:hypothetical protein
MNAQTVPPEQSGNADKVGYCSKTEAEVSFTTDYSADSSTSLP